MSHIPLIWEYVTKHILEISSLSTRNYISIVGHYASLVRNEEDEVSSELKSRGYSEAQLKSVLKQKEKLLKLIF